MNQNETTITGDMLLYLGNLIFSYAMNLLAEYNIPASVAEIVFGNVSGRIRRLAIDELLEKQFVSAKTQQKTEIMHEGTVEDLKRELQNGLFTKETEE